MPIATSWDDVWFLLIAAAIVALLTAVVVKMIGHRLARRSRALAVFICALTVPASICLLAIVLLVTAPNGPPPNDAPAMVFIALFTLGLLSAIVSVPTSAFLVRSAES